MRNYYDPQAAQQMADANPPSETETTPPHRPQPLGSSPEASKVSGEAGDSIVRVGDAIASTQIEGTPSAELGGEVTTRSYEETPGQRTSPFVVTDEFKESR